MRTILFYILLLSAIPGHAQYAPVRSTLVRYDCLFNELFDRGRQEGHYLAELHLQGDSSYFFLTPNAARSTQQEVPNTVVFHLDTLLRVFKDHEAGRMVFGDPFLKGRDQYFMDSLFPMRWEFQPGERKVGELTCKTAKTRFKGREYTCWYCPDIPIPEGPWKLGGLPGLIVEAYDEQDDLHFTLSSMGLPTSTIVAPPKGMNVVTADYESYREQWRSIARKIEASMAMSEGADCVNCETRSKIKFHLWERPLD